MDHRMMEQEVTGRCGSESRVWQLGRGSEGVM